MCCLLKQFLKKSARVTVSCICLVWLFFFFFASPFLIARYPSHSLPARHFNSFVFIYFLSFFLRRICIIILGPNDLPTTSWNVWANDVLKCVRVAFLLFDMPHIICKTHWKACITHTWAQNENERLEPTAIAHLHIEHRHETRLGFVSDCTHRNRIG